MTKGQRLFMILTAMFLTFLIMAEVTSSKFFSVMGFTMTMGTVPFPITFIITDLLNEYYGRRGVRFVTLLGMGMLVFVFILILIGVIIPAASNSPVSDEAFRMVFANSGMVIIGSMIAYLIGQLIDIQVFYQLRKMTNNKHIWLRATGSTVISQLLDSVIVLYIAFGSQMSFSDLTQIGLTNYIYKFIIALSITPVIYYAHFKINQYLGDEATYLIDQAKSDTSFQTLPFQKNNL